MRIRFIALAATMVVVGLSMLLALWRLVRGPTAPDRILALDTQFSYRAARRPAPFR